ncbi:solute carrier family 22 member 20-like isoform X2 [Eriocheir sinensis]|uniref:solute carrier family 22 member 20-like isoform X2 n=1 Tax=Eriocheir sinensis TaxID=95602 RepID=UPI0021C932CC|nr:solute carrier family 22 member 20-like isoform X2 [Eriocheir sinensis]
MSQKSNIDDVLTILGFGRWQIPIVLLTVLIHMYITINIVGSTLLSVPKPFRCFSTQETISNISSTTSTTTSQPLAATYDSVCEPTNQTEFPTSPPSALAHASGLPSCPVVEYDPSESPYTVITEFDLVCERAVLRPLFQISVAIGIPVGGLLGGVIGDKYGRKTVVIGGNLLSAAGVLALAACPWYLGVLMCRFLLGITFSLTLLPSYSLAQEVIPLRMRSQSGMLMGLGFSIGAVIMAGIGYLVRPWRYLLLAMSSYLFVIIPWACMVEESPRWLMQKGRQEEAAAALERAAYRNRVFMSSELITAIENLRTKRTEMEDAENRAEGEGVCASLSGLRQCFGQFRKYFRYPGLRLILLVSPVVWYLQSLLYMGILLNANNFTSNDPFLYVALSGVADTVAVFLGTPLTMKIGRCLLLTIFYSMSGVLLLLDIAIPTELRWLKWVFVMTAFLLSSAGWQAQFIYTPELYPTVMRSRGFGLCNAAGSLGTLTAPLITDLLGQQTWWSVNVVCGTAGLIAGLLMRCLPETRNLPMPETLQDVERRRRSHRETKAAKVVEELNVRSEEESPLDRG